MLEPAQPAGGPWTEEMNQRRVQLLEKRLLSEGELTSDESEELDRLQRSSSQFLESISTLDTSAAETLLAELRQESGSDVTRLVAGMKSTVPITSEYDLSKYGMRRPKTV